MEVIKPLKHGGRYRDSAAALRDAHSFVTVPPTPNGAGSFDPRNPEAELRLLAANGWQLRAPAASTAGLVPVTVTGDCLAPLSPLLATSPRLVWFDPTLPALDGDYVIAEPSAACMERIFAQFQHSRPTAQVRAARERFAPNGVANNLKGKILRCDKDGRTWITNKDVALPLATYGTVLGVVRKIVSCN
jgi:hypothetical protein